MGGGGSKRGERERPTIEAGNEEEGGEEIQNLGREGGRRGATRNRVAETYARGGESEPAKRRSGGGRGGRE